MSKPDFQAMKQSELKEYFLAHREDQEAFYAYVDRLHAEANWIEMPALESEEDFDKYPEFLARIRRRSEP